MRHYARIDANQPDIVAAFRNAGWSVQSMATIGKGCPDILIAHRGRTICVEIKDGAKPPSARRLTPDEVAWRSAWNGEVLIVESLDDVMKIIKG